MSTIIAAKYGGPCIKCGKKIKAGSFVNWDRGRGIWHLDETDNKKLGSSMLDPTAQEVGDSCHPDTYHREEEVVSSNDNSGTISIDDLVEALQQLLLGETREMTKDLSMSPIQEIPIVVPSPKTRELLEANEEFETITTEVVKSSRRKGEKPLTSKQLSFCELMALGSNRADAYTNSYNVTNPVFSGNAGRKLLEQEKIRNKIAELRGDLHDEATVEDKQQDFFDAIRSEGATGGWAFRLTEKQEKFCQAMANGATVVGAFKKSGYAADNWTERRMRREANRLMKLAKVKIRIASLMSGNVLDIEPVVAGEDSHKTPRTWGGPPVLVSAEESVEADQQPEVSEQLSAINGEFVDNFMELIKAHGRLVHHAIVTRGQKEVGIPGADVEGMEEAVFRSLETLRDALNDKLSNAEN